MKNWAKMLLIVLTLFLGFVPNSSSSRAFGKDGGSPPRWPDLLSGEELTILGRDNRTAFGREITSGDINGDGAADLIVSAPYGNSVDAVRAEVFVFPGPLAFRQSLNVPQGAGLIIRGDPYDSYLGEDLDAGDFNGDGYDDLVLTSRPANAAFLYLGAPEISARSPKTILAGPGTAAVTVKRFNTGLGVCDLNGDRLADLFVIDLDEAASGLGVRVLGVLGRPGWSAEGHTEFDLQAGQADITVTLPRVVGWAWPTSGSLGCGDVDGDGTPDLVFGAFGEGDAEETPFVGRVYVIRGDRRFAPGQPVDIQLPDPAGAVIYSTDRELDYEGDYLGYSLSVDDVDGDGRADLILGAPYADGPGNRIRSAGEVYLWLGEELHGQEVDLTRQAAWGLYGDFYGSALGLEVNSGDFDGDGRAEILLGCEECLKLNSPSGIEGRIYLVDGDQSAGMHPVSTVDRLEILPPNDAWSLGNSVGAADLDSDGRDDLLFGIPWWGKGIPGTVFAMAYPDRWLSFFPLIGR